MATMPWPDSSMASTCPHVSFTAPSGCSFSELDLTACARARCAASSSSSCAVDSEVVELMKKKDWSKTPIGAPKTWPGPMKLGAHTHARTRPTHVNRF
jgi:hypothetical protein